MISEEMLVYAILMYEGFDKSDIFEKRLTELFLNDPHDDDLLELECLDIKNSIIYIRTHFDYENFSHAAFGKVLMREIKPYYYELPLKTFAERMFMLWESLPPMLQDKEPFWAMSYADEPLSWGDEEQTKTIYLNMLKFYENENH